MDNASRARKKEKFTVRSLKAYLMAEKAKRYQTKVVIPEARVEVAASNDLSSLTVVELKEIAKTHGVNIAPGTRKADIISVIEHAGRYGRRDMRAAE